jgi:hypothetical protein
LKRYALQTQQLLSETEERKAKVASGRAAEP